MKPESVLQRRRREGGKALVNRLGIIQPQLVETQPVTSNRRVNIKCWIMTARVIEVEQKTSGVEKKGCDGDDYLSVDCSGVFAGVCVSVCVLGR